MFKPGCLMQNDVDDVPYMPSASHNASNMQKISNGNINNVKLDVTEKFALRKNFIPPTNTTNSPKPFLGQCKAGGCLDPPFSEDKYAYKPTSIPPNTKNINNDNTDNNISSTENIQTKSSDDLLLDSQIKKKIRDSVISDSLITYPETISISKTKNYEESQNVSNEQTSINTRLLDNEFTELYYIPPKNIKKSYEEIKNKKYIDSKVTLETKESTPGDTSLLDSDAIIMAEPELLTEDLLKDNKSDTQKIYESTNKKSASLNHELHNTLENQDKKFNDLSKSESTEVIDSEIKTFVSEKGELEPISINMKEILNEPKNKYNALQELQNDISINSSIDISNASKDLLARNSRFNSNDSSCKKSHEIDEERTVVHTTQSIDRNQLSSSEDIFTNRPRIQIQLRDGNENKMTPDIENSISEPKKEHLVNSTEESILSIQEKTINSNVVYNTLEVSSSSTSTIQKHILKSPECKNEELEYGANINKIQQSPKLSKQTLSNTEIKNVISSAEKLSIESNGIQHSKIISAATIVISENFNDKQSTLSDNAQKYDQNINKMATNGQSIREDLYSRKFNESKELITNNKNDMDTNYSSEKLKIRQDALSESNISIKTFHSKISDTDDLKTNNFISGQKGQDETYNIQKSSTTMSSSKLSKDTPSLLSSSNKSSGSKKSKSEDLTKINKILNEPNLQTEEYYNVPNDDISNKQRPTSENRQKDIDANYEDADTSSLRVKRTDSNNFSQTNTMKNSEDFMSNMSENIELLNSTRSESYKNNDFEDHKIIAESPRKSDLSFDKNTSYVSILANSDPDIKKYTSPSLHSIDLSRKMLQKSTDAARSNILITERESNITNKQNDKTKPEYLDSSQTIKIFESTKKNVNDFMTITNDYDNILLDNNDVNKIELKRKTSPPSVALTLDFHISNNDDNTNVFIRTFDPTLPPEKDLEDKFVSIKCVVTEKDEEIKIPINSDMEFTLGVKKKTSSKNMLNQTKGIHKTFSEGNINSNSLLHDTLNSVYNNLLPLKDIINNLRQEIKSMSQQQMQFIELLDKMETKPLRLIDIDKTCKCQKQTLADMCAYYG